MAVLTGNASIDVSLNRVPYVAGDFTFAHRVLKEVPECVKGAVRYRLLDHAKTELRRRVALLAVRVEFQAGKQLVAVGRLRQGAEPSAREMLAILLRSNSGDVVRRAAQKRRVDLVHGRAKRLDR